MEFRTDSKELNAFNKKKADIKLFEERAICRVDWCFSQHIIKGGNTYQRM